MTADNATHSQRKNPKPHTATYSHSDLLWLQTLHRHYTEMNSLLHALDNGIDRAAGQRRGVNAQPVLAQLLRLIGCHSQAILAGLKGGVGLQVKTQCVSDFSEYVLYNCDAVRMLRFQQNDRLHVLGRDHRVLRILVECGMVSAPACVLFGPFSVMILRDPPLRYHRGQLMQRGLHCRKDTEREVEGLLAFVLPDHDGILEVVV
mmetsp:Transcript_51157/g.128454  ORF Transcript_51157/g.128454 Transcript_51157/m.128454 type:complete len:204 (+) Transcript_51157:179-790(+)